MNSKIRIVCFGNVGEFNDIGVESCRYTKDSFPEEILDAGQCDLLLLVAALGREDVSSEVLEVGRAAKERGIPVGAFVTSPFRFEGAGVGKETDRAIQELKNAVDFYHVFACDDVLELPQFADKSKSTVEQAFKVVDHGVVLRVRRFVEMFENRGLVCMDFQDALCVLKGKKTGTRIFHVEASASGENGIGDCLEQIKSCSIAKGLVSKNTATKVSRGLLVRVTHGEQFSLLDYNTLIEGVYEVLFGKSEDADNAIIADALMKSEKQELHVNVWYAKYEI